MQGFAGVNALGQQRVIRLETLLANGVGLAVAESLFEMNFAVDADDQYTDPVDRHQIR